MIVDAHPDVVVGISYGIRTYRVGKRRLYVGAWNHGVSVYGWRGGGDGGFTERRPDLITGKGTVRLTPQSASSVSDSGLRDLLDAVLSN